MLPPSNSFTCPADRQPCEVVRWLPNANPNELRVVLPDRPCEHCRIGQVDIEVLADSRARFGKHERRVLLLASRDKWTVISTPTGNRSTHVGTLRAVRHLVESGFLDSERRTFLRVPTEMRTRSNGYVFGSENVACVVVKLTTLGAALVEEHGDALRSGKRVRWAAMGPSLHRQTRLRGVKLAREFVRRIRDRAYSPLTGRRRKVIPETLLEATKTVRKPRGTAVAQPGKPPAADPSTQEERSHVQE